MNLTISLKQIISYSIWLFVITFSIIFQLASEHEVASFIFFLFNILSSVFCIIYTYKNKNLLIFSPIFHTIYCITYCYTFMGLFCLSKYNIIPLFRIPFNNEPLLITISCIYCIAFSVIFLPFFSMNKLLGKIHLNFLAKDIILSRTIKYLYYSFIFLIFLLSLIYILTGYSPITGILNPAEFRNACNHGWAAAITILYSPIFFLNYCLTVYILLFKKVKSKTFISYSIIFFLFCLYWSLFGGGRGVLVSLFVNFILIYSFKTKLDLNLKKIIIGIIAFIVLFLFIGIYGNYRNARTAERTGQLVIKTENSIIISTLCRLDTYAMSLHFFKYIYDKSENLFYYNDYKNLASLLGKQFAMLIPREYIKEKPWPTDCILTKEIFPNLFNDNVTLVWGGVSVIFYEAGFIWLLLNFFFLGIIVGILQKIINRYKNYDLFKIIYIRLLMNYIFVYIYLGYINQLSIKYLIPEIIIIFIVSYIITDQKKINVKI